MGSLYLLPYSSLAFHRAHVRKFLIRLLSVRNTVAKARGRWVFPEPWGNFSADRTEFSPASRGKGIFRVVLTRTIDQYVSLENRIAIANATDANVFFSIGHNGFNGQRAKGMETYFLSMTHEKATIKPLEKTSGSDLEFILSYSTSNVRSEHSRRLSFAIHAAGVKAARLTDRGVKSGRCAHGLLSR